MAEDQVTNTDDQVSALAKFYPSLTVNFMKQSITMNKQKSIDLPMIFVHLSTSRREVTLVVEIQTTEKMNEDLNKAMFVFD
ncbi:unnamed protein product [Adineta ricciae]|uniref:Uncharacterized protein n=1 Tax=Adineta ricciae TaxID=249248 RepID=A0A814JPC9_ADIRI|nr:unnamed protein product [Adineta ricciae]